MNFSRVVRHLGQSLVKAMEMAIQAWEHLYRTTGSKRELWIESLGMSAVLPPPEEVKEVETAIGPNQAKPARASML